MALDNDGFLPTAFRKVQKIRKGLKSSTTSNIVGFFFIKKSIHETWKSLEGSQLHERFFLYILTRERTFTHWGLKENAWMKFSEEGACLGVLILFLYSD